MTNKVDIKRLDSVTKNDTTATERINDNFLALQAAIENTLSRDGTGPNYMDADLDMNSYRIINSSDPVEDNDIVNLKYVEERIGGAVEASKTAVSAASQAASSAQSALVSSTNAINTLRNAEEQLSNTITYVDEAKQSITDTINSALEDVKQQALDAAQESIDTAAEQAEAIVIEHAETVIKPELNEIASNASESADNAAESAELAANESANAAISATDSQHYAEDSRIWAEGSDSEVKNVDGEHSSKVWSEMAKTSATSAASSADLARQYGNDKINQTHITNCITEIPQDIKLELNNGTLTLKAGSKVYVPNGKNADGSNKFDAVVVENDISKNNFNIDGTFMLWAGKSLLAFGWRSPSDTGSGNSTSSFSGLYYRTDLNKIFYNNDTSREPESFPICIFTTANSGVPVSIDQVFNGFGYIGSTVYALPGVKGLIPNGRNADGSLKNIEFTLSSVKTSTRTDDTTNTLVLSGNEISQQRFPATWNYDAEKNIVYSVSNNTQRNYCVVGQVSSESTKITSFNPKTTFHAVDRNDSSWVSAQAMPSDKRINLTIGASPTQFTAPANGWFDVWAQGGTTSNNKYLEIINNTTGLSQGVYGTSNYHYKCHLPAKKGDKVSVQYNNMEAAPDRCRFIYSEGEV